MLIDFLQNYPEVIITTMFKKSHSMVVQQCENIG